MKRGGANVFVWGCFTNHGIEQIHKISGIMDCFIYKDILQNVMLPNIQEKISLK